MEVDSWMTGRRAVALPFTDFCPPLGPAGPWDPELWERLLALGRRRRWRTLELRTGERFESGARDAGAAPVAGRRPSVTFHGHWLDLTLGEAALAAGLNDSLRRANRKAERSEVIAEFCDSPEAMRAYYALHCLTRRKHGAPPQPWSFFAAIQRELLSQGLGWVGLARRRGRVIAGAVFVHLGKNAIYKFGASEEDSLEWRGNNLLMWQAILRYARLGFEVFHFGRTSLSNAGLRRFKLGWGAREELLAYFKYDFRRRTWVADADRSAGWQAALFRRLPLPVNRWIGARLYPHLA
jgi:hypothetical protein